MFLARIRFPKTESIPSIIRRRYGDKVLREICQFEKLDYKHGKLQLDLDFLRKCKDSEVISNFLNFHLANKKLQDFLTYNNCQRNLLVTEINLQKSHFRLLKKEFYLLHSELKSVSTALILIMFAPFSLVVLM